MTFGIWHFSPLPLHAHTNTNILNVQTEAATGGVL